MEGGRAGTRQTTEGDATELEGAVSLSQRQQVADTLAGEANWCGGDGEVGAREKKRKGDVDRTATGEGIQRVKDIDGRPSLHSDNYAGSRRSTSDKQTWLTPAAGGDTGLGNRNCTQ